MSDLRERVRERRRELGWTQQRVADEAGVSHRTYQGFESGQTTPQGGNLRAILRALGLDQEAAITAATEEHREEWPGDVRVFLDMIGAYLMTLEQGERDRYMYDQTRRIIHPSNNNRA